MARYQIRNVNSEVLNVTEWDGVTPYDPGEGLTLHLLQDAEPTTQEPDLVQARLAAIMAVQGAAEAARTRYAMNLAFQGNAYDIKAQEADAYIALGRPADTSAFVLLTRSAQANGKTVSQWADAIVARRDSWIAILAETEGLREEGINAIKNAQTLEAIHAACDQAKGALNAI